MSSLAVLDETELFAALCGRTRVRDEITMSFIAQDRGDIISFVATHAGLAQVAPSDAAVQAVCALVNRRHGIHLTNDDVTRVRQLAMSCFACYAAAQARQATALGAAPAATVAPSAPAALPESTDVRGQATVAQRQWIAYNLAR